MIRLRGKKTTTPTASAPAVDGNPATTTALNRPVNKRHFLKTVVASLGLVALAEGHRLATPRTAEATYYSDGTGIGGADRVNTGLEVQGNLYVSNAGKLGIGTLNPATGCKLHVKESAWNTNPTVLLEGEGDGNCGARLELKRANRTWSWWADSAVHFTNAEDATKWVMGSMGQARMGSNQPSSDFTLGYFNGAAWTVPLVVTTGGNIGIATTGPGHRLTVASGGLGTTAGDTVPWMELTGNDWDGRYLRFIHKRYSSGTRHTSAEVRIQEVIGVSDRSFISFRSSPLGPHLCLGAESTIRLFIDWNGYLGIGTESPTERLDVAGNVRVGGTINVNGNLAIDATGVAQKSFFAP